MAGEKILVCDDEKNNILVWTQILEKEDYKVKGVQSGLDAIKLARQEHFDLLVIDFIMPGINGMETFQTIKKHDPEIVGIIVTGYGTLSTAIEALEAGFQGFITKPFTFSELLYTVADTLEKVRLQKELIAFRHTAKLKDDFLALISHELRAPSALIMSSIRLLTNMLGGKTTSKENEILSILKIESNRLSRIISNLLLISELKFQAGEHPMEWISLKDITEIIVNKFQADANEKSVVIENLISNQLPKLYCVKGQIKLLIANLLDNAIKFNMKNGKITINAHKQEESIKFEIEDTGIGIDADKNGSIFNPFQQAENPLTRKQGGAGLGLAISKEIVSSHNGEIWVEDIPERGSRFIFKIPRTGVIYS